MDGAGERIAEPTAAATSEEMRDFARVVRRALLMIVAYLERRYGL